MPRMGTTGPNYQIGKSSLRELNALAQVVLLGNFGGMVPKLDPRALPDGMAALAYNCKLYAGTLQPFYGLKALNTLGAPASPVDFYDFVTSDGVEHYVGFADVTDVVRAPLLNDAFDRLYFTNSSGPYITTRSNLAAGNVPAVALGVPAPAFTNLVVGTSGGTTAYETTRVYVATLVSQYGEESAPSAPVTVTGNDDGTWTVTGINTLIAPAAQYTTLQYLRLYRTVTTTQGVNFYQVAQFALNNLPTGVYTDGMASDVAANQYQLPSLAWNTPPANLYGLVASPAGFLAAFVGRTVYFSEPYYPHAWPDAYQLAVEDDIVGLGLYGSTIVVLTKGRPYVIQGTQPGVMSLTKIDQPIPCLSRRGIVSMEGSVIFPTYDGLMAVSDSGLQLVTQSLLTKDQWSAYSPSTLVASQFEGRYYAFYNNANGFVFDPSNPSTSWMPLNIANVKQVRTSYVTGYLQLLVGNTINQWDSDTTTLLPYYWKSGDYMTTAPVNLGAAHVRADISSTQTLTMTMDADGVQRFSYGITTDDQFRLPSGYKAKTYNIALSGTATVYSVAAAPTGIDLRGVL